MTLKQVIDTIQRLGEAHEMIETTFNGAVMDRLAIGDVKYPLFTFDATTGSLSIGSMSIPFQMFFIDRLVADLENEREIQSQMLSVAQDIIAQLRYPGFDFTVGNSSDITFITDTTPDLLAGVTARVLIDIPYAADRCQVPSDFIF